jgi:hypothetical protein
MARVPKAIWLIGLAVGLSHLCREDVASTGGAAPARVALLRRVPMSGQVMPGPAPQVARIGPR